MNENALLKKRIRFKRKILQDAHKIEYNSGLFMLEFRQHRKLHQGFANSSYCPAKHITKVRFQKEALGLSLA